MIEILRRQPDQNSSSSPDQKKENSSQPEKEKKNPLIEEVLQQIEKTSGAAGAANQSLDELRGTLKK